jgi:hypothetical protein
LFLRNCSIPGSTALRQIHETRLDQTRRNRPATLMVKLDSDGIGARTKLVGPQTWTKVLNLADGQRSVLETNLSEFDDLQ